MSKSKHNGGLPNAAPVTKQHAHEIQAYGHVVSMPIALSETTPHRKH